MVKFQTGLSASTFYAKKIRKPAQNIQICDISLGSVYNDIDSDSDDDSSLDPNFIPEHDAVNGDCCFSNGVLTRVIIWCSKLKNEYIFMFFNVLQTQPF